MAAVSSWISQLTGSYRDRRWGSYNAAATICLDSQPRLGASQKLRRARLTQSSSQDVRAHFRDTRPSKGSPAGSRNRRGRRDASRVTVSLLPADGTQSETTARRSSGVSARDAERGSGRAVTPPLHSASDAPHLGAASGRDVTPIDDTAALSVRHGRHNAGGQTPRRGVGRCRDARYTRVGFGWLACSAHRRQKENTGTTKPATISRRRV